MKNENGPTTRLEMRDLPNGRTEVKLFYGTTDISNRVHSLSLHVNPSESITAEIVLLIDSVEVSAGVVNNIVEAVLPQHIIQAAVQDALPEGYDGPQPTENSPRTFG